MRRGLSALLAIAALALSAGLARADILITVDKSTQRISVQVDGVERYNWAVSTGRTGRDTPSGTHRAFRMERDHYSKEWDDAPMPHSIFFTDRGHAIHGSYDTKKLGGPASAGCVRLAPQNAATLFALVEEHGVLKTKVVVDGDIKIALARQKQRVAARPADDDDDVTASIPQGRQPMRVTPDVSSRPLPPPPNPFSTEVYGRQNAPRPQADDEPFEVYAQRMRERYYRERAARQPPAYDYRREAQAGRYYGYDGRVYYMRRPQGW